MPHEDIRIGTIVGAGPDIASYLRQVIPHGFESFEITFGDKLGDRDPRKLAEQVKRALDETPSSNGTPPVISAIGLYGNPLEHAQTAKDWETLIDACRLFGEACTVVSGFTGCLSGKPVPDAMPRFKEVFTPLATRAEDAGVRIAFENCDMGGRWECAYHNIAHAPAAWEMMFDAVPSPSLGLEWEPCHQMCSLVDPLPQLRQWVKKIYHLHGKDATVDWPTLRTRGSKGGARYAFHRHPGFGDSNWTDIISILRLGGFHGAIDIEGWHDPVYKGDLEMTGQVHALHYLRRCRGGDFVPNPSQA